MARRLPPGAPAPVASPAAAPATPTADPSLELSEVRATIGPPTRNAAGAPGGRPGADLDPVSRRRHGRGRSPAVGRQLALAGRPAQDARLSEGQWARAGRTSSANAVTDASHASGRSR